MFYFTDAFVCCPEINANRYSDYPPILPTISHDKIRQFTKSGKVKRSSEEDDGLEMISVDLDNLIKAK